MLLVIGLDGLVEGAYAWRHSPTIHEARTMIAVARIGRHQFVAVAPHIENIQRVPGATFCHQSGWCHSNGLTAGMPSDWSAIQEHCIAGQPFGESRRNQFVRSASTGAMRMPRRAGTYDATVATTSKTSAVTMNVHGSSGSTW